MTRIAGKPAYCASYVEVNPETGCWEWTGSRKGKRYAQIGADGELLHRRAYEEHVGPIPDGFDVDHKCRNTFCSNPEHLEAVTHRENCLRGNATRLSEEERALIKQSTAASHLIAQEFGVSPGYVRKLRGRLKDKGVMRKGIR